MGFKSAALNTIFSNLFKDGSQFGLAVAANPLTFTETSGENYKRINIRGVNTIGGKEYPYDIKITNGSAKNTGMVYFPRAGGSWTTANYLLIFDSTGKYAYYGSLNDPISLAQNQYARFKPDSIRISLSTQSGS